MVTIKIKENSKQAKAVLEMLKTFPFVEILETGLSKPISKPKEKSTYDPKFVAKIKRAEKRGNYKTVDPNDVWGSLGLK